MRRSSAIGAALLATTMIMTDAPSVDAAPLLPADIDKALAYIKDGLRPFQAAQSIFGVLEFLNITGGSGVNLANKLDQVEARLIQEIQFWMDVQRDAATTAAFRKYEEILRNPGQTSLNRERILFLTASSSSNDAGDVYAELERLILDNGDLERSMQLTMPFNTLGIMMAQAMVWHDQYFPEEDPFSWWSFNEHYGRTYRANYSLVKVSRIMCDPGYNPELGDIVAEHDAVFETSRLYKKRANKSYPVGTMTCRGHNVTLFYNPVTNTNNNCIQKPQNVVVNGQSFGSLTAAAISAARAYARSLAQSEFRTADDVDAVREAIRNLRFLSGGDALNGIEGNMNASEFFDPWVNESALCPAATPWAYVQRP